MGECLESLYPESLKTALSREALVDLLSHEISRLESRPLLLVGYEGCGKTTLLHQTIRRKMAGRFSLPQKGLTWHVSPARLISGMSYVGQWESRLQAILNYMIETDHILFIDEMLSLFQAGQSAQSDVSVANVIKSYLDRSQLRLIGELTPEAYRIMRERDRGFADLFQVVQIAEPQPETVTKIMIRRRVELESEFEIRMANEVIPQILALGRRHLRNQVFPGKAVQLLDTLAVKYRGDSDREVGRKQVVEEFSQSTGLSLEFVDDERTLERAEVTQALKARVVGQGAALDALADSILIAKARLNDPQRPLGTFLFLGPTGVGKTECAKSLAEFLFGSESKLLRFDMNEYTDVGSSRRLTGTFAQSEGLLTSQVRYSPFSVVLFDEIEKADPEVFDLLLQVLGEGRLTDARGHTVDFTQTLVILTSNLGVSDSERQLGFRESESDRHAAFVRAAERFFRPEFFNRLDRVVPFSRLSRTQMEKIVNFNLDRVATREGIAQRRGVLDISDRAREHIIDIGYHPELGARAIKRAIEDEIIEPLARFSARLKSTSPTRIEVLEIGGRLGVRSKELEFSSPGLCPQPQTEAIDILDRLPELLGRLRRRVEAIRPPANIPIDEVAEHHHYFEFQRKLESFQKFAQKVERSLEAQQQPQVGGLRRPKVVRDRRERAELVRRVPSQWDARKSSQDLSDYLRELYSTGEKVDALLSDFENETRYLAFLADNTPEEKARVLVRTWGGDCEEVIRSVLTTLTGLFALQEVKEFHENFGQGQTAIVVTLIGPGARALVELEAGVHLIQSSDRAALRFFEWRAEPDTSLGDTALIERRLRWQEQLAEPNSTCLREADFGDPEPLQPVIRVYSEKGSYDLRSGQLSPSWPRPVELFAFLTSQLGLPSWFTSPDEIEEASG